MHTHTHNYNMMYKQENLKRGTYQELQDDDNKATISSMAGKTCFLDKVTAKTMPALGCSDIG